MKMPCGKYKGKELKEIEVFYLNLFYDEHKPVILELERGFKIFPRERRSEKVEINLLFDEMSAKFPDNEGLKAYHEEIIRKYYTEKRPPAKRTKG
jgi:hypothetical protein